jgi:hypothetical protein
VSHELMQTIMVAVLYQCIHFERSTAFAIDKKEGNVVASAAVGGGGGGNVDDLNSVHAYS